MVSASQIIALENSKTFQDLALKFPGFSRTKPLLQDFPEPGNFTKIQDFPGGMGTRQCSVTNCCQAALVTHSSTLQVHGKQTLLFRV